LNLAILYPNPGSSLAHTARIMLFSRLGLLEVNFCTRHCLIDCKLCSRILIQHTIMKIVCPSDWYTAFGDSSLSTIRDHLSLNPYHLNCSRSPRSQLYLPSQFLMNFQCTVKSVLYSHHLDTRTTAIMNYLPQTHIQRGS
jgi:hypothetical protein